MKPTNTNLAKFYGLTRQTIGTYKKEKHRTYNALKEYFKKKCELTTQQLKEEKKLLTERLNEINAKIKEIKYAEMLAIESKKGLTKNCRVSIITKTDCPANYASLQFLEYLGIEDPYPYGYHQVRIGYRIQGCDYHTYYHSDISEIEKIDDDKPKLIIAKKHNIHQLYF
jgi:hypothetical protein